MSAGAKRTRDVAADLLDEPQRARGGASAGGGPAPRSGVAPRDMDATFERSVKNVRDLTFNERKKAATKLIGQGREFYVKGNLSDAFTRLQHAIRVWPHSVDAYQLLGIIAQDRGDEGMALELWLLQASFMRKGRHHQDQLKILWQDLYRLATKLGRRSEAIYCLTRVHMMEKGKAAQAKKTLQQEVRKMSTGKTVNEAAVAAKVKELKEMQRKVRDLELHRIALLEGIGEWTIAVEAYRSLFIEDRSDVLVVCRCARVLMGLVLPQRALAVLEAFLEHCKTLPDDVLAALAEQDTFTVCANMTIELYLNSSRFSDTLALTDRLMQLYGAGSLCDVHPEIAVKYCIALVYLGRELDALETFAKIRLGPPGFDVEEFGDLFFDFSKALLACGHSREALTMLEEMARTGYALPVVIFSIARCNGTISHQGDTPKAEAERRRAIAEKQYRAVLESVPQHIDSRADLCDLLLEGGGDSAAALSLLDINACDDWTPEETLTVALLRMQRLRRVGDEDAATEVAIQILEAMSRDVPPEQRLTSKTRLTRLLRRGGHLNNVLSATSAFMDEQMDAKQAVQAVSITKKQNDVAERVLSTIEKQGEYDRRGFKRTDKVQFCKRLGQGIKQDADIDSAAGVQSEADVGDMAAIEDDLKLALFLGSSGVLRQAYALAGGDTEVEPFAEPPAKRRKVEKEDPDEAEDAGSDVCDEMSSIGTLSSRDSLSDDGADGKGADPSLMVPVDPEFKGTDFTITADALKQNETMLTQKQVRLAPMRSLLLQRLITAHVPRGDGVQQEDADMKDGIGMPMPSMPMETIVTDKAMLWNPATLRVILQREDFGMPAMWRLLQSISNKVLHSESIDPERRNGEMYRLISILTSFVRDKWKIVRDQAIKRQARQLIVVISLSVGNFKLAYKFVRRMIMRTEYHTTHFWNVLNMLLLLQGALFDMRAMVGILRFKAELNDCFPLMVILGNCIAYRHGNTKLAIAPYLQAHNLNPKDPLVCLCLSVLYTRYVMPRGNANRHYTFLHSLAFLDEYKRLRLDVAPDLCSETEYNAGRLYHQLGLVHLAASHYQRVLDMHDNGKVEGRHSLHREAAFNMHLILRESGNTRGAADILRRYIVI